MMQLSSRNTRSGVTSVLMIAMGCVIATAALVGCGKAPAEKPVQRAENAPVDNSPAEKSPATSATAEAPLPESKSSGALKQKIKFKRDGGETAFSLKPQSDGAKLVDENEKELARYVRKDDKLKVKDPNDKVLGYVIAYPDRYKIKNAEQDVELWRLQRQEDGDWKLEDGQENLFYKIKRREYGFEIEDANKNSLFKVKLKDGKTSLRDVADKTVYYTKDPITTSAVICLGLDSVDSLPLQAGLMTMLLLDGAP